VQTRKYPRTLDEAFGSKDYCEPIERPIDTPDRIVLWACTVAAAVVGALVLVGWLK